MAGKEEVIEYKVDEEGNEGNGKKSGETFLRINTN
jgi:hypothetical protein